MISEKFISNLELSYIALVASVKFFEKLTQSRFSLWVRQLCQDQHEIE